MPKKKLKQILEKYAELLDDRLVVEPQAVIRLKPKRDLTSNEREKIHERVEVNRGCYDHFKKEWILPNLIAPIRLPAQDSKPNRLYVRDKTLRNLLFLEGIFRGKQIKLWTDIRDALKSFRPERVPYSKATCRDYLAALKALQPESAQV
jgi:hypothetical protein